MEMKNIRSTSPFVFVQIKWSAFKANVQATWFWRVYGVCAMKRTWTKLLVAVSLSSCFLIVRAGPGLLTPILELKQMNRHEGILINVFFNPKGHNSLLIKTDNGEELSYPGGSLDAVTKAGDSVGKRVTIWTQRVYDGWPPFIFEGVMEVKQKNKMLINYSVKKRMESDAYDMSFIRFFLYLGVFSLLMVGWLCRKAAIK
jgi:hypothetical protein